MLPGMLAQKYMDRSGIMIMWTYLSKIYLRYLDPTTFQSRKIKSFNKIPLHFDFICAYSETLCHHQSCFLVRDIRYLCPSLVKYERNVTVLGAVHISQGFFHAENEIFQADTTIFM
jgi:hypothetical protein